MLETRQIAVAQDGVVGASRIDEPPASSGQRLTFALLIAGLLLNGVMVLLVLPRAAGVLDYSLQLGDLYDLIGQNLAQSHGYRVDASMGETMLREPGHPLFVAAVFKISGYGVQGPRIACVLLTFGAALILMRLARKITGDRTIALLAALLYLVYPGILVAEARAGVESLCVFTVLLFMLTLYRAIEQESIRWYGLAGFLLGLATLVRSEVFLFPSFVSAYCLFSASNWRERRDSILRFSALGVATLITISPWVIRNYLLVHKLVPSATLSGVAAQEGLYTCQHLPQDGQFWLSQRGAGRERAEIAQQLGLRFVGLEYYQFFYTPQDEVQFNLALLNGVSQQYRKDPQLLMNCGAKNLFFKFWFLGKTPRATLMNIFMQLPLLACALGGFCILWSRGLFRKAAIILLYIAYVPLLHTPIIAHARHSMFVVPFLAILAAIFLMWVWVVLRKRQPATTGSLAHG